MASVVWLLGPLIAAVTTFIDLADAPWWWRALLIGISLGALAVPVALVMRRHRSALVENGGVLRPGRVLGATVIVALLAAAVALGVRVLVAVANGGSLAAAAAEASRTPLEPAFMLASCLLLLYLRVRRQSNDEGHVTGPQFIRTLRHHRRAAQAGTPIDQLALVGLMMLRAERVGDFRAETIETICTLLKSPSHTRPSCAPLLLSRLVRHLRVAPGSHPSVQWLLRVVHTGQRGSRGLWPESVIDLSQASLPRLDLADCHVHVVDLAEAELRGRTHFARARINQRATFEQASFKKDADFRSVRFAGGADFDGATFGRGVDFSGARFGDHASFHSTRFSGEVRFPVVADAVDLTGALVFAEDEAVIELPRGWSLVQRAGQDGRSIVRSGHRVSQSVADRTVGGLTAGATQSPHH